jgi:hypothetical protein
MCKLTQRVKPLFQPSSWIAVISCNDNYWLHSSAPYHGCKINKYIKSTQNTWQTIIQNLSWVSEACPRAKGRLLLASPPPKIEMALPMVWQKSLNYTIFPTHVSYRSSPWRRDTTVGVSMQQTHPIWFCLSWLHHDPQPHSQSKPSIEQKSVSQRQMPLYHQSHEQSGL